MVTINAGHTLFAKWAPNTYTITFDAKEGAISDFTTKKATYGQAYGVLPVPISSRDNDKFVGWWTGLGEEGIQVSNSTVFTGLIDITLYAKWKFDVYIGEAGGLVFYENPNYLTDGWRYLEAAPFGWYDGGNDPTFQWGSVGYPSTNPAISTAVGTGKANTESIVFHHDTLWIIYPEKGDYYTNPTAYSSFSDGTVAAKVCTEYSVIHENKTYNDWFLPSKDELALMKINLHEESLGGFTDSYYWSSSLLSYSSDGAWAQYFKSWQHQDGNSNSFKYLVRPVRAY